MDPFTTFTAPFLVWNI